MTAISADRNTVRDGNEELDPFPEILQVTVDTICGWWMAGFDISEHRDANWLYLVARGSGESAVYKIVGPYFSGDAVVYEGFRIA